MYHLSINMQRIQRSRYLAIHIIYNILQMSLRLWWVMKMNLRHSKLLHTYFLDGMKRAAYYQSRHHKLTKGNPHFEP